MPRRAHQLMVAAYGDRISTSAAGVVARRNRIGGSYRNNQLGVEYGARACRAARLISVNDPARGLVLRDKTCQGLDLAPSWARKCARRQTSSARRREP